MFRAGKLRLIASGKRHDGGRFQDWVDKLSLVIYEPDNDAYRELFGAAYDLLPMLDWLSDNEEAIRRNLPLIDQREGESLGQTFARAKAIENSIDEQDVDLFDLVAAAIDVYNGSHNFYFSAPGSEIPEIFIGRTHSGYEVSNLPSDGEDAWAYQISIDDFYANLPSRDYGLVDTGKSAEEI